MSERMRLLKADPVKYQRWLEQKRAQRLRVRRKHLDALAAALKASIESDPEPDSFDDYRKPVSPRELTRRAEAAARTEERERLRAAFREECARLYATGLSTTEIGAMLGRTDGVVWKALKDSGVTLRDRSEAVSAAMKKWFAEPENRIKRGVGAEEADSIIEKYRAGASLRQVAEAFGREKKSIRRILLNAGERIRSDREQWSLMFEAK